jgi:hypothetical protein
MTHIERWKPMPCLTVGKLNLVLPTELFRGTWLHIRFQAKNCGCTRVLKDHGGRCGASCSFNLVCSLDDQVGFQHWRLPPSIRWIFA